MSGQGMGRTGDGPGTDRTEMDLRAGILFSTSLVRPRSLPCPSEDIFSCPSVICAQLYMLMIKRPISLKSHQYTGL